MSPHVFAAWVARHAPDSQQALARELRESSAVEYAKAPANGDGVSPPYTGPKVQASARSRSPLGGWGTRWALIGSGVVLLSLVGALALIGLSWLGTYQQAQSLQRDVTAVRTAVEDGNWSAVPKAVGDVRDSADSLDAATRTVPWRLLEGMPVIGSSASGLAELARVVASVAEGAEPLTPFAERIIEGRVREVDGSVDVAAMQQAAPLLERLSDQVAAAVGQLDAVDIDGMRPEVAGPIAQFRTELADVLPALSAASDAATWLPGMLGADGERTWLVLLQNPAEARGTGGFIGGYVTLSATDGSVALERTGISSQLAGQPIPVNAAPVDARETWGDALQRWGAFNVSPHFPMTAALAADGMAAMGERVDGVIAVDPQAVASMLQITGPVTAMGKTITAEDAAAFFTVDAYREYPDGQERDEVSMALVEATFRALLAAPWTPKALVDALRTPVEEERLLVWSANTDEQQWLDGTVLSGGVVDQPGSVVAVALNNSARNKMDAFVSADVDYRPGRCPTAAVQRSVLRVALRNDAPADLPAENYSYYVDPDAPPGTTRMLVHLYVPVGANFQRATINEVDFPIYAASERNRPVWWTYLEMPPGQEQVIEVTFEEPTVLGVEPRMRPQPMVNPMGVRVEPDYSC